MMNEVDAGLCIVWSREHVTLQLTNDMKESLDTLTCGIT
jgi:hypothetical protein